MSLDKVPQIYCRQPKTVELISCQPNFTILPNFEKPSLDCRCASYSSNGEFFAYIQPNKFYLTSSNTGELISTIDVKDIFDFQLSPNGKFLITWSTPVKDEESGNFKPNVKIFNLNNSSSPILLQEFTNKSQSGWRFQFTHDESLMCKLTNSYQIDFFSTTDLDKLKSNKPLYTLNTKEFGIIQSFQISPGKNPSIAIFIPEKKGKPAYIKVYSLPNLKKPSSQKQFFKGETCKLKWNDLGTSILALVSTDVDTTNKSYYGESTLYLLGISGAFDQRINLDKEGPIHDITWSPTSREFAVIYGYMPSITTFFDARGNQIHSLPPDSRNTILFSPHAKYILVAGFGNLQGNVDILDRQNKFNKLLSFKASNTSVCKWSPDGRYILTATTSPRLRVDNCVKIWNVNGSLCYVKEFNELLSVDWRSQNLSDFPPIKNNEPSCAPHISAIEYLAKNTKISSNSDKPVGAYRPPHARHKTDSSIKTLAQIESAQLARSRFIPGSTASSSPSQRTIPGATPVASTSSTSAADKNRKKRQNKKNSTPTPTPAPTPAPSTQTNNNKPEIDDFVRPGFTKTSPSPSPSPSQQEQNDSSLIIGGVSSIEDKKIRSLLKKLRAIESLKNKQINGESLEDTQILKIKTEDTVRKELKTLGWSE